MTAQQAQSSGQQALPSGQQPGDPDRDILAVLERAHRMSVSDPTDPSRRTLYGEAADEIRALREQLASTNKEHKP